MSSAARRGLADDLYEDVTLIRRLCYVYVANCSKQTTIRMSSMRRYV